LKTKHWIATLCVLGSIFWLAIMTTPHIESLTNQKARASFIVCLIIAYGGGLCGLTCLVLELYKELQNHKGGKNQ